MAKKDWKKTVRDAFDALADRLRDLSDAMDELLGLSPELQPVPVPTDRDRRRRS